MVDSLGRRIRIETSVQTLPTIQHLFLGSMVALILPLLGFSQADSPARTNATVQLVGTVAVDLPGKGTTLFWSEKEGYVNLQREGNVATVEIEEMLRFPKHQFKATGKWKNQAATRTLNLQSITPIETLKALSPPIVDAPVDLSKRNPKISRVYLEGTVVHCNDRVYSLEILMDVDDQPVICFVRSGSFEIRKSVQADRRLGITGYLWHRHASNPAEIPITIVASKKSELRFFGQDPATIPPYQAGEKTSESRLFPSMQFMGIDENDMALFRNDELPVTAVFDHAALNITTWDLDSGHRYNLVGKVVGTQRGNLLIKNERLELAGKNHPELRVTLFHLDNLPSNGSRVRFAGVVQGVPVKHKDDWTVTLLEANAEPRQQEVRVVLKNVGLNWPKLDLRQEDEISVVGMYQGRDSETAAPTIVVSERNRLSFITPTRAGRNWLPLVVALGGILLLSALWVTLLRRAVRQRTKDVRDSEAKLMTVYQSVPQGIVAVDMQQQIFGINRAFYELFELEESLDGRTFNDLHSRIRSRIVDTERWDGFLQRVMQDGRGQTEQTVRTKDIAEGPQQIGIQVETIDREAGGQIWMFRDLTETRELESSLAQARRLETVGRLTGGIAHDFNNILTGVTGNLSMLEHELNDPPLLEYVQGASDAAQHAAELVRRLLDYTKQTRLEVNVCSVNDILTKLYEMVRHSVDSRIRINLHLAEDLHFTKVDPVKIEQVLMNLVLNAIDAMPNGGELVIRTENSRALEDPDTLSVTIGITDNGSGIPPELLDKIFEPYFTTKSEDGNGLGLPTSRGIIEQHDGTLSCSSTQGQGTAFYVVLPATEDRPEPPPPKTTSQPPATTQVTQSTPALQPTSGVKHVVVIDDELAVRKMISHMLVRSGFEVICFPNGREALDYIEQGPERIDLIVSDNSMPVMDGIETFEQVRSNYPDIPFIVASGYLIDLKDYAKRAKGSRPEAFIQKPLRLHGFIAIVNNVLATAV